MKAAPRVLEGMLVLGLLLLGPASGSRVGPTIAHAFDPPYLGVSASLVGAGQVIFINVSHFVPGGYTATVQIDGTSISSFEIPPGGSVGSILITIPPTLAAGGHDLSVCAACGTGDTEQRATRRIVVTEGSLADDRWNATVQAIEITQGVRGSIATRDPIMGPLTLPPESAVHVANRRTVVRVYPFMAAGINVFPNRMVTARLFAEVDGVPVGPIDAVVPTIALRSDRLLDELRGDLSLTWNFNLPDSWTSLAPLAASKNLDLRVQLTPVSFGECGTCGTDNTAELNGSTFAHVGQSTRRALTFRPFRVEVTPNPAMPSVIEPRPTLRELQGAISSFYEILPIGHEDRGILLYPWIDIDWSGTLGDNGIVFDNAMIRRFPASWQDFAAGANEVYAFMRNTTTCAGHAYLRRSYMFSSSCGGPLYVAAHELSHCIGRPHAGSGHGEADPDPMYPGSHGQTEANAWGFNTYTGMLGPPFLGSVDFASHDFMSYGPQPMWISLYNWNRLTADLGSGGVSLPEPPPGPFASYGTLSTAPMLVTGTVDAQGTIAISPWFSAASIIHQPGGELLLHFTDGIGNTLADRLVTIHGATDPDPTLGGGVFAEVVEVPIGWSQLQVGIGPNPQLTFQRSPSSPTVTLLQPNGPFQWEASGTQVVKWIAADADNDALTFRVVGQRGTETHILASDVTGIQTTLDLAQVPGGGNWVLRVEASDGFNSSMSQAVQGIVDPHAPRPLIIFPRDSTTFVAGQPVTASGVAADFQDELDGSSLTWWLDGAPLGSGASMDLPNLSAGAHTLEVRALNKAQLQGSMSESFFVVAALEAPMLLSPANGASNVPDPTSLTWSDVPGALSYRVQVGYGPDVDPVLAEFGSVVNPSFAFDGKPGYVYSWRVRAEYGSSPGDWSAPRMFAVGPTVGVSAPIAGRVQALRAYPNPIATRTTLEFALGRAGSVNLSIFDVAGRRVCGVFEGALGIGPHMVTWDGRDSDGRVLAAGTYVARLIGPDGEGSVLLVRLDD